MPSGELAREMTAHYLADTERLGLGRPDHEPLASDYVEPIVALIADLVERGHAYAAGGDVYFRVRSLPAYGELSHRASTRWTRARASRAPSARRIRSTSRSGRARRRARTPRGPRRGARAGRAGTSSARRWPRSCWASSSTSTAAASTCCSPTTRTRRRRRWPRAAARWRGCGCTTGCCSSASEKMAKSEGNIRGLAEALDEVGRDALVLYFVAGHYRQPIAYDRERLEAAAASVRRIRDAGRRLERGGPPATSPRSGTPSSTRWPTTSTPRRRCAGVRLDPRGEPARGPGRRRPAARDARDLRLDNLLEAEEGAPEGSSRSAAARGGPRR